MTLRSSVDSKQLPFMLMTAELPTETLLELLLAVNIIDCESRYTYVNAALARLIEHR